MKTQISNLINGSKNVIRFENHSKYQSASPATSHVGYAGTNSRERNEIAERVYNENGDNLHIIVRGIELNMPIHKSVSGKTWSWGTELSSEQYKAICGEPWGIGKDLNSYTFTISDDCTVHASVYHRKNERQEWKHGYTYDIDEAFVTIL